jgi:hypothetical protein
MREGLDVATLLFSPIEPYTAKAPLEGGAFVYSM